MLMTKIHSKPHANLEAAHIHNYYEQLVRDTILNENERAHTDSDFLADVSCVALNHLPPRYIRHDVDMNFFMSPIEIDETQEKVKKAVNNAIDFVSSRENKNDQSSSL